MPARHLYSLPRAAIFTTVIALLLAALSACGQKGALHLPERTPMVIGEDADEPAEPVRQPAGRPDPVDASDPAGAEDDDEGDERPAAPEPRP